MSLIFGQSVEDLLARDSIPVYKLKKLPAFFTSIIRSWINLDGTRATSGWVIPRTSGDSLPLHELTARFAYSSLRSCKQMVHRSLAKFQDLGMVVNWPEVWASLQLSRYVRSLQDTCWLVFHGIAPTADRLLRFGMQVDSLCFCGLSEDRHLSFRSTVFGLVCFGAPEV